MKNILALNLILSLLLCAGCGRDAAVVAPIQTAGGDYICPMKCKGLTFKEAGKCPVCGMNLELPSVGERPLSTKDYAMELTTSPAPPVAGQPVSLHFQPMDTKAQKAITKVEIVHERPLHLILVSQDLSWFGHEHPEPDESGGFTLTVDEYRKPFVFPSGGQYWLYADWTPIGDRNQVHQLEVSVSGPGSGPVPLDPQAPLATSSMTVQIKLDRPTTIAANVAVTLSYSFAIDGKPIDDLELYLGAAGHLLALSPDGTRYVHAHPDHGSDDAHGHDHGHDHGHGAEKIGPAVPFSVTFPAPGLYKVWGQFLRKGEILVAAIVVEVV